MGSSISNELMRQRQATGAASMAAWFPEGRTNCLPVVILYFIHTRQYVALTPHGRLVSRRSCQVT